MSGESVQYRICQWVGYICYWGFLEVGTTQDSWESFDGFGVLVFKIEGRQCCWAPTYDQEPEMVAEDDALSKEKEIDKLMALISLSFKKIYKPTNNNLRTSSNTSRANHDNTPRINRGTGYDKQRVVNIARAKENVEQADSRDDTDDEPDDQELEAYYMYMAQIQEVTPDVVDNFGPIFDAEPLQKVKIDCAKAKGDLMSYKMESQKSLNEHTRKINDLNKTISKMKKEFFAHQETISIMSQGKEAQKKFHKTREDKELEKVITLENKIKILDDIVYKTGQSVQTMNMLNRNCKTSFVKPEFLKKAQRSNPRLYDIGCYNDNLDLVSTPDSDETIRLAHVSRSKLSNLIKPFDYKNLNNLYDLFVPQREKSSEQRYFSERSKMSHTPVKNENSKESFNKQTTLLEKRMDESIPWDQKCKSSKELFKIKSSVDTIFDGVERCKQTIAKRTYFGHIDPFIQNTIEGNFCPQIRRINADLEKFHLCLKEEMVADLRYFNSLEHEVDSLKSQLETQKTQFLNEIDRLSREYYYADHMNAILGVYTTLDEFTDLQYNYVDQVVKCERLEKEFSKSNITSKSFEALQQHAIDLELALQQCQEQIKNDKAFKENQSKVFLKEREQYFKIQDLKAQLQDKGIVIRVIPTTSVSRPQLKSNRLEDRVMHNNSEGKKQQVEDHHRNFKFSNNKTFVTACNDSLNAKTSNVNFVCVTCGKCVLNDNHDMCVLLYNNGMNSRTKIPMAVPISTREHKLTVNQSTTMPLKRIVAAESTN
ncbi:hypothetical protein Tco_0809679 [Tanacetum coccineum]